MKRDGPLSKDWLRTPTCTHLLGGGGGGGGGDTNEYGRHDVT